MMRKKWIWTLVIGAPALAGGLFWWRAGPLTVAVVTPTRGPAVEAIYATGTVEPTVMLPIAPRQGGKLAQITVDEGTLVKKGQILAQLDDADLDNTVDELESRLRLARLNLQRKEDLASRNGLAKADLDQARTDLEMAESGLKRATALRGFMTLTAPADGLILRRDGEVGQFIPAGQTVFWFSCCAPLRVTAEVDEEDIPRVRVGQAAVLHADALPSAVFDGMVGEITPKGDPVARSFRVRIRIKDPARLQVGMTVDANLIVTERADALLVPSGALQNGALWVLADGRLHRQGVRTGVTGAVRTEVLEGLAPDAQIVATPTEELHEGAAARPRPPAAAVAP
ncbi:efflux RND transporter periplasmic adaptor subunit [uncultured Thiodictyon sp.]|uniref:efflux RND transporter periplasmic adaptor subunit n=1 Tax=uncultured Thiodictyon sp. TaxID=1846217 RepID=UPI0025E09241|nr:efflux RND transporter periplasmic adaptor subunit [uncultured Thiodictyon sp.]